MYEKTDKVAMGSPESPVIANFFMEVLEERALKKFPISLYSFRYVNDAFVIWPHGSEKLGRLLDCLSGPHRNIHFTMQTEKDSHLPFSTSIATGDRTAFWGLPKSYLYKRLPVPQITPPSFQHESGSS